jgi:hypothetical protein
LSTFALVDGGYCTAEYLWCNGIKPAHILFSLKELEESVVYCDPSTDVVLLVVNGCTTLSYSTIKETCGFLSECPSIERIGVFSNIPLEIPHLEMPYTFFEGDLMNGKEYTANTATGLKGIKPNKQREITKYLCNEATEQDVDIGDFTKKCKEVLPDPVNCKDIVQVNIFKNMK